MMPKPWLHPQLPIELSSVNHSYAQFGLTTDVVREPLSTYTPLKYQSSAPLPSLPCRGSLRTPKCQSAPLLDVLVENGPAVLTSELLPVECQKVTWLDEKFCLGQPDAALHRYLQLTISYATLCHTSAWSSTFHLLCPLTIHCRLVLEVPCSPLIQPYFSSVK